MLAGLGAHALAAAGGTVARHAGVDCSGARRPAWKPRCSPTAACRWRISARCFTARHYDLPKDDCQFRCLDHPDGLALATREGAPFLTLNGIQTQSAGVYSLIGELGALRELGVASLRLSPQSRHMGRVIAAFQAALAGEGGAADALARVMPGRRSTATGMAARVSNTVLETEPDMLGYLKCGSRAAWNSTPATAFPITPASAAICTATAMPSKSPSPARSSAPKALRKRAW